MPSRFDQLCQTHLDPYVDEHFGESVRFLPMRRTPNGRAAPDPERAVTATTAVLHLTSYRPSLEFEARSAGGTARAGSNDLRTLVDGTGSQLSVQIRNFTSAEDRPRQGDYVECAAGRFEIVSAQPGGTGRLTCQLVALGRPSS